MASRMRRVSTHILDLVHGKPASGVPVRLEMQNGSGDWRLLTSTHTDQDGRCAQMIPDGAELAAGIYRLSFDTGSYHAMQNRSAPFADPIPAIPAPGFYPADVSISRRTPRSEIRSITRSSSMLRPVTGVM